METVVIDTVGLGDSENANPFIHIGWRVSRERKDQPVMFASKKRFATINGEFVSGSPEFP